jgi:hypothetical protein
MKKERHHDMKRRVRIFLVAVVLGMAVVPALGMAQSLIRPEMHFPKHYPEGFHGVGIISRITSEFVMIDDQFRLPFSRDVQFHKLLVAISGRSQFSEGDRVGYLLNEQKEVAHLYELPQAP